MIVGVLFVNVVGKAGVEDCIHSIIHKLFDVSVHYLCRIAGSIGGDRELSLLVSPLGGH